MLESGITRSVFSSVVRYISDLKPSVPISIEEPVEPFSESMTLFTLFSLHDMMS